MSTSEKTEDFYNWFKDAGGSFLTTNPEEFNKKLHPVTLERTSTLKNDPERIKKMYNHKFKKNVHY